MKNYDWSKFDIYFYIESPPAVIFDKWATATGLESFFMRKVVYETAEGKPRDGNARVKAGDTYKWEFIYGPVIKGEILDARLSRKFSFSFGDSIVDIVFTKSDGRTLVHLRQRNIPVDEDSKVHIHLNCRGAWIHFLTVLKSVIEFNTDCRDQVTLTGGSLATGFFPEEYSG